MTKRDGYKTKLANEVDISVQYFSMLLSGDRDASYEVANKIQRALHGGGIIVWMDPDQWERREVIFNRYKDLIK